MGAAAGKDLPARQAGDRQRQLQLPLRRAPAGALPTRQPPDAGRRQQHAERRAAGLARGRRPAASRRAEPSEQHSSGDSAGVREADAVAEVARARVQQLLREPAGPERLEEPPGDRHGGQRARAGVPKARPEGGQRLARRQQVQRRPPRRPARILLPPGAPGRVG
ncbi:hypothetical protein ACQ4PT_023570 [Festuca glaucescens]